MPVVSRFALCGFVACAVLAWPVLAQPTDPLVVVKSEGVLIDDDFAEIDSAFGSAISISGDVAAVGSAWGRGVFIFERSGSTGWYFTHRITKGAAPSTVDGFGSSLALAGDTLVVADARPYVGDTQTRGAVYIYKRSGDGWTEQQTLTAPNPSDGDGFGRALALSGDTLIVSSIKYEDTGTRHGAAYVFVRAGDTWSQQAQLIGPAGTADANFGASVALSGDTALVGTPFEDTGVAYVFVRANGQWSQEARLSVSDAVGLTRIGAALALSGNTAALGHYNYMAGGSDPGHVYMFSRTGQTWSLTQTLTASDPSPQALFGTVLALNGDTLAVGSPGANNFLGSSYVFARSGADWTEVAHFGAEQGGGAVAVSGSTVMIASGQKHSVVTVVENISGTWTAQSDQLTGLDGAASDALGRAVAVSNDLAAVGAPGDNAVYLFARSAGIWTLQQRLALSGYSSQFGAAIALDADTLLVGAPSDQLGTNRTHGSVSVFTRSGTGWMSQAKLVAKDMPLDIQFGSSVALSGDTAVVGARSGDGVYVFVRRNGAWEAQGDILQGESMKRVGYSVAIDGDTLALGATFGTAYLYERSGGSWQLQQTIVLENANYLESSVALDADTLVVTCEVQVGMDDLPVAEVYTRPKGTKKTWTRQQRLTSDVSGREDAFGSSVALLGDIIVIGAPLSKVQDNDYQGAAHVFVRAGGSWSRLPLLLAGDGVASDEFGDSVALSRDGLVVGASERSAVTSVTSSGARHGAAYAFSLHGLAGTHCSNTTECAAPYACVDGVCCTTACGEACGACSMSAGGSVDGQCTPVARSAASSCEGMLCNGIDLGCPGECDSDAACEQAHYCNETRHCVARLPQGTACDTSNCADSEHCQPCSSGHCVDGVCCDGPCDEPCSACAEQHGAPRDGSCGPRLAQTAASPACPGHLLCDGVDSQCPSACGSSADCDDPKLFHCDEQKTCQSNHERGNACESAADCRSGLHCVDGVCCNDACVQACEACDDPDHLGTCTAIVGRPHGSRPGCGSDAECGGTCDGNKRDGCSYPAESKRCGTPACVSGDVFIDQNCDGQGKCVDAKRQRCAPWACNSEHTACAMSCETSADCVEEAVCNAETERCAFTKDTCVDANTSESPGGVRTSCSPYACGAAGVCRERCERDGDCAEDYACDTGRCIAKLANSERGAEADGGGCGCSAPGSGRDRSAALWLLAAGLWLRFGARTVRRRRHSDCLARCGVVHGSACADELAVRGERDASPAAGACDLQQQHADKVHCAPCARPLTCPACD